MMSGEILERPIENNIKNKLSNNFESPESNSNLTNKKEKSYDYIPIIKSIDISNKKISTSSLPSGKKKIYNQKFIINFNSNKKNIFGIYTTYDKNRSLHNSNSCPILILNNFQKTSNNKFMEKSNDNFNQNFCVKTFYNKNSKKDSEFILDKRIKLAHKQQQSHKGRNKKNSYTLYDSDYNDYYYHKLFDRKLPLNELRFYRKILLNKSKGLRPSRASSQYLPQSKEFIIFKNTKNSGNSENSKNYMSKNSNNSITKVKNEENNDSNYEKIELGGVSTKVMIKFPKFEKDNDNEKKNEDFHNIIKHPFTVESFGYKYMKNLKDKYKIYKNPLDDKDLIKKIRHLIVNPNTKEFRNYNLMFNSKGFYRRKNSSLPLKNYKLLSQKGLERLKNDSMNQINKNVNHNLHRVEKLQKKLDLIMERNVHKFQEHQEEVEKGDIN